MSLRKLGRYDIVRVLGKGAMGIVYEGRDPNLDRPVAIKTVKVENLSREAATEYEARFRTEARSAARLQHPNIVSVYDSDRDGDVAFLVMEYIQGDDLKQHLDQGERYSLEQSLRIIGDLLAALDYAHKQGIVHRDIKPANLLIEPGGRVKLTDFGVARIEDSGDATRTQGAMVGTLKYMSPEQVQGQKIDARADLFSVGVLLYQLLTDERPFDGENEFAIIQQIVGQMPPPPSSFNARLPAAIDAVVARALAKNRDQRYATAGEFAAALQLAMRQAEDVTVVPPSDPARRSLRAGVAVPTNPGTWPMGSSAVTQELELVYWKDVKDSAEAEDLEVFLAKFPTGIYADLARRRLRKLAGGTGPDQTIPIGIEPAVRPAPAPAAARAESLPTWPLQGRKMPDAGAEGARPAAAVPAPRAAAGSTPTSTGFPATVAEATQSTLPDAAPAAAAPAAAVTPSEEGSTTPVLPGEAPSASRRRSMAVMAGIGVLAAAGLAALLLPGRGGDPQTTAAASSATSVPVAAAPASAPAALASAGRPLAAVPAEATRRVAVGAVPASASRKAAPAKAAAVTAAASPVGPAAAPEPPRPPSEQAVSAPPVPRDEPRTAVVSRSAPANPADACKDKMFLSREFCLAEQCDKPAARNHPLCVQRREDAKLREESKIRN